jgi:hypothetical protein
MKNAQSVFNLFAIRGIPLSSLFDLVGGLVPESGHGCPFEAFGFIAWDSCPLAVYGGSQGSECPKSAPAPMPSSASFNTWLSGCCCVNQNRRPLAALGAVAPSASVHLSVAAGGGIVIMRPARCRRTPQQRGALRSSVRFRAHPPARHKRRETLSVSRRYAATV